MPLPLGVLIQTANCGTAHQSGFNFPVAVFYAESKLN